MSAFLAPIHFRMYDKIGVQEDWIRAIAAKAVESGWAEKGELAPYLGDTKAPLEEVIDQDDIHSWISARIESVESRYAALVTRLLRDDASRLEALKELAYRFGEERAAKLQDAMSAYQALDGSSLDGMPCDVVNVPREKSETVFTWERQEDVHSHYWSEAGGDPAAYFALRSELARGLLAPSGFEVTEVSPNVFQLAKGVA